MNSDINSTITVIANAIENDTQNLKALLKRNGIKTDNNTSKDELQVIVNTALINSETFRKEFTNWVLQRSNAYSNANGFENLGLPASIGYTPGQTDATQLTSTATSQTFGGLNFGSGTSTDTPAATPPKTSPWVPSLNTLLQFAQTGMNSYVAVQQSKTEQDTVNAALEAKRLELQMNPAGTTPKNSSVVTIAVVSVLALATVGGIIFYMKKRNKMDANLKAITEFVPWAVVNDRQKVIQLLSAGGILVDSNHISDEKLTQVVMDNLFDAPKFRDIFYDYLKSKFKENNFSNAGGFLSGTSFGDVAGLVTSGLGFLGATQVSKDQRAAANATAQSNLALAQAQVSSNQLALETAKLQLQAAQAKPASNSTMIYVGLAVFGVVAIGAVIYAVTKK